MKTYKLYVCMPMAKFNVDVKAEFLENDNDRLTFYIGEKLITSYPSQYTIIEKITENEN